MTVFDLSLTVFVSLVLGSYDTSLWAMLVKVRLLLVMFLRILFNCCKTISPLFNNLYFTKYDKWYLPEIFIKEMMILFFKITVLSTIISYNKEVSTITIWMIVMCGYIFMRITHTIKVLWHGIENITREQMNVQHHSKW